LLNDFITEGITHQGGMLMKKVRIICGVIISLLLPITCLTDDQQTWKQRFVDRSFKAANTNTIDQIVEGKSLMWKTDSLLVDTLNVFGEYNHYFANHKLEYPEFLAVFKHSDLPGGVMGMTAGQNAMCIYSDDSYLIVDGQWNVISQHSIDHPNIKKDAAFVNHVLYKEGAFYLLVFDHSIEQSYIIVQPIARQPQYSNIINRQIHYFDIVDGDYLLMGLDERLLPWIGRIAQNGKKVWEERLSPQGYIPQGCFLYDGKVYLVSNNPYKLKFLVTVYSTEGKMLKEKQFLLSDTAQSIENMRLDIFAIDTTSHAIALFGQQLSNSGMSQGVFIQIDKNLNLIKYQVYDDYVRIQSAVEKDNHYYMLANTSGESKIASSKYIIREDGAISIPLESKTSMMNSIGIFSGDDSNLYVFGLLYQTDRLDEPSTFISEITLK
jgi:hypothetical protein